MQKHKTETLKLEGHSKQHIPTTAEQTQQRDLASAPTCWGH